VPFYLLIIDVVVIVLLILLFDVFVVFLLCTSNLCNKFLVYILNVSTSSLLNKPVLLLNYLKELLLVLLEFNNY
jgi:hypothetical protein